MAEIAFLKSSHDEEILKFVYTFEGHFKLIQNHLYCQWTEGTFCDLELQTFDGCIPVHGWLFACFSPKIATVLNDSGKGLNSKKPDNVHSLDIFFTYDVVKAIVEAIYSGIFTATLEKLGELQAALQWLEMHEFVTVIKCIQDKAVKENRIAHDRKPPLHFSVKSERRKSLRNTQKSKFSTRNTAGNHASQNDLVPLVKNMPVVISQKKKKKGTVSNESITGPEKLSLKKGKEMSANLLPSGGKHNIVINVISHDDLSNNEHCPEHPYDISLENSDLDLQAPQMSPSTEISGVPGDKHQRKSMRKRSIKGVKAKRTRGRPPQTSEKEESQMNKIKSQRSSRRKKKPNNTDPQRSESALENLSTDIIESEEEKKKDATEALMTIGRNIVKAELPEVETLEAVNGEEVEQAILNRDFIKCDKCSSSFPSLDEYNDHVENHPTYTCEKCSRVYYTRTSLVRHVRSAHLKSMHLKCSECDFMATDDKSFEQHCANVHEEFRPFKCLFEGCKFQTSKYRYLSRHFENHDDKHSRTRVCEKCHKTFNKYDLLYSHRRSCYHVQKYLCDMCGQSFNHPTSMKIHRRTMHFGEKPYSCKVCLKSFGNGANLRRHMRIHNNSFPYSCHICMKQFRHSNTLKLHISKRHAEAVDTSLVSSHTEQTEVCTSNSTSFHHQPNSSLAATNSSVQLCSIPSFTSSLPTVLSTVPTNDGGSQVFSMPPLMTLPSVPSDKPFALSVNVSHAATASFLQYEDQLSWQETENYRLSSL